MVFQLVLSLNLVHNKENKYKMIHHFLFSFMIEFFNVKING